MSSILDKFRDRIGSEDEREEEIEERETNLLEADVIAGSGLEVNELVAKISSERGVNTVGASRGIYQAMEDGRVVLVNPNPPSSLVGYLSSIYSSWFWLIVGFVALLLYTIYLMPQIYPLVYLRIIVGIIYVLYVPGYTFVEALYPKKTELERLERFALSIGMSLALVPLVGLVLNYTPWGIRLDPILASLSLLTVALGFAGVYRRYTYWRLSQGLTGRPEDI